MARFAVVHSREVAARHYADLPSLRPLHETAVAAAFRAAVAAAMPTVLPPTAEQALQIGRAHVCTPVTNAHIVCRLLLENKKKSTTKKQSCKNKFPNQKH